MNVKSKWWIIPLILGLFLVSLGGCPSDSEPEPAAGLPWDNIPEYPPLEADLDQLYAANPTTMAQDEEAMALRYRERYPGFPDINTETPGGSKVYFTKNISPAGLADIYEALGKPIPANAKVAVKINMAEAGNVNRLDPDLIADLFKEVKGTLVDSTTFYDVQIPGLFGGTLGDPMFLSRGTASLYRQAAITNGYTVEKFGAIDILNATGSDDEWSTANPVEVKVPITAPDSRLQEALLGAHIMNYDWILSIAHFKGHSSAGYGGTFKNLAIGIASYNGKKAIHQDKPTDIFFATIAEPFQEKVVEYNQALMENSKFKQKIVYINVLNNLSDTCDCIAFAPPSEMPDIGILASFDPVALEKASMDKIYAVAESDTAPGNVWAKHLVERMEAFRGPHQIRHAAKLKLGHLKYEIVDLDT
jgi:uncharacterized Fe-S center protein